MRRSMQPCTMATLMLAPKHSPTNNLGAQLPPPPFLAVLTVLAVGRLNVGNRLHAGSQQAHVRHTDVFMPAAGRLTAGTQTKPCPPVHGTRW